jgi:predicted AAA+ superfamily ATPase
MANELFARSAWVEKVKKFHDTGLIKVITGIRRCGKSSLMRLCVNDLLENGVPPGNVIHINFELMEYDSVRDYNELYKIIKMKMAKDEKYYIFIDEPQQVKGWEKAVNSLRAETDADICITGSNAWLLSSEIATLLSGRYVEIHLLPLSFKEFIGFGKFSRNTPATEIFNQYLKYGGFPDIHALPKDAETTYNFLNGIYNTVIVKDILSRHPVKEVKMFERLIKFLAQNTGNLVSPSNIANYINSSQKDQAVKSTTVSSYLDFLEKAYIVYPSYRYDVKGKELLKTLCKYYIVDTGLRGAVFEASGDVGSTIETVVYFELLRSGYKVFAGKQYDKEIDFLAVKNDERRYYQVALSVLDETVRKRELAPLISVKDNYEKTILTMDTLKIPDVGGIKFKNVVEWLLEGD